MPTELGITFSVHSTPSSNYKNHTAQTPRPKLSRLSACGVRGRGFKYYTGHTTCLIIMKCSNFAHSACRNHAVDSGHLSKYICFWNWSQMRISDRGKVGCSRTARDLWLRLRLVLGPRNSPIPHPPPPTLKVSISAVPRNPIPMLECYNEPICVVFVKRFTG